MLPFPMNCPDIKSVHTVISCPGVNDAVIPGIIHEAIVVQYLTNFKKSGRNTYSPLRCLMDFTGDCEFSI